MAVLDAPTKHLQDIIRLLLIVGADLSIMSNSGLTAHAVALEQSNQLALDTFEEFQKAAVDSSIQVYISIYVRCADSSLCIYVHTYQTF